MSKQETAGRGGDRVNPVVFFGSSLAILIFALWTILFTGAAETWINTVLSWVSHTFGWYYFLTVVIYLVFVIGVALSRFGDIKLGPAHSKPEFNILSWAAMLFAAGIGIDLLFFCLAEPVTQFLSAPGVEGMSDAQAARHSMELTFLHWGVSGWGIYTLVGMSLAYFSYRHNLPLTIRSALYPIFGKGIYGPIGHTVDIAAVLGTVFGIATSLGIGVIQLNAGLNLIFNVPESTLVQAALVVMIIVFATISAVTGVEKGIRRLSEFNMLLTLLLLLFVLLAGNTVFLLNALITNVGDYVTHFVDLSLTTYAFDRPTEWLNAWTLFFWAWWIAWGPFVGLFLARISRGRSIRQFTAGTLLLPMTFMMAWMSIIGNSGIDMVMSGANDFAQQTMNHPASSIYLFLTELPWTGITTIVTTILAIVFFVTSGDSGALVLSNFTAILSDVNHDAPTWMRILWAAVIGIVTLALLTAGGLTALQSTTVIMGLPFSVVLFFIMAGLLMALRAETLKKDSRGPIQPRGAASPESGAHWQQRLRRAMSFPGHEQARRYITDIVQPAMEEVRDALQQQDLRSEVSTTVDNDGGLGLSVALGEEQDFLYEVRLREAVTPAFAIRPHMQNTWYFRLEVHLQEGGEGYDLMDYTRQQVIEDILDQYERHLDFLQLCREAPGHVSMPDNDTSSIS
ncbi:choline BCCT transporter BetT [Salinisphaera sp. USBA-960]|uniref:choline BCCT transporter BetT n=1 Tax=Salinisphaera orenii TaxID=856731 RepID=UPI000DBEA4B7|nr:choline BCCT transporter BetT [Salifodinibacter halophilus]NNC26593.1 choline BCCT transporter BetT [Salifodinibacter halophilus]